MFTFATDYFLFVFVATLGVIQLAASLSKLDGLLIFKSPPVARILGLVLTIAPFIWFFATGDGTAPEGRLARNINDFEGGLDAPTQSLFFFLGAIAGGGVTFAVSSIVNMRMHRGDPSPYDGLDSLKDTNYVRALLHSLGYWWRNWRTQTKSYFSG